VSCDEWEILTSMKSNLSKFYFMSATLLDPVYGNVFLSTLLSLFYSLKDYKIGVIDSLNSWKNSPENPFGICFVYE
jgi:hypothetical protein